MILSYLEEKLIIIVEQSAVHSPEVLLDAIDSLDKILNENRNSIHPRLAHFLQRRSYGKALAWVRGDEGSGSVECQIAE